MIRSLATLGSLLLLCTTAQAQTRLEVLDYGAQPMAPIRYQFQPGQTERATMEMSMSVTSDLDGQAMPGTNIPPVRMTMSMRVTDVAADGSARLEFETRSAEAAVDQAGGRAEQAQLSQTLAGLSQLSGWYRTDTRGRTLETGVSLPAGLAQGVTPQMINEFIGDPSETLQQFPDEPVGQGARWRVVQQQNLNGVKLSITQEFTLRSRSGDRVELEVKHLQTTAAPAGARPPGAMPGTGAGSSAGEGSGKMTIDLHKLIPASVMESHSTTTMNIPAQGGQVRTMKMLSTMRMSIAPE